MTTPRNAEPVRTTTDADSLGVLGLQDVTPADTKEPAASRDGRADRILTAAALVAGGFLTGAIATFLHRARFDAGFGPVWLGIVASLLVITLIAVGIRLYLRERIYVTSFAAGVIVAVVALAMLTFGHSAIILADLVSTIWAAGAPLLVSLIAAWPRLPERRERYSEHQSTISKEAQS